MTEKTTATRYAAAVIGGVKTAELPQLKDDCAALLGHIEKTELGLVLKSPMVTKGDLKKAIDKIIAGSNPHKRIQGLLSACLNNHRAKDLGAILARVIELIDINSGHMKAQVTSAKTLSTADTEALTAALAKRTGQTVEITSSVDANLIGGVIVRMGSLQIDDSVKTKLDQLRRNLISAAS